MFWKSFCFKITYSHILSIILLSQLSQLALFFRAQCSLGQGLEFNSHDSYFIFVPWPQIVPYSRGQSLCKCVPERLHLKASFDKWRGAHYRTGRSTSKKISHYTLLTTPWYYDFYILKGQHTNLQLRNNSSPLWTGPSKWCERWREHNRVWDDKVGDIAGWWVWYNSLHRYFLHHNKLIPRQPECPLLR